MLGPKLKTQNKEAGMTLIEFLIASALGTSFLLSVTTGVAAFKHHLTLSQHQVLLTNELRLIRATLSMQLKRAGFYHTSSSTSLNNTTLSPAITISHHAAESAHSCILFDYDKNQNGVIDTSSGSEHVGFRLRDGSLEYRMAGRTCDQNGWHDLNDIESIKVTHFEVIRTAVSEGESLYQLSLAMACVHFQGIAVTTSLLVQVSND